MSDTADVVADIWMKELNVSEAQPTHDFFEQGGTSLAALRVSQAIQKALGVDLDLTAVFEFPRLADLTDKVHALQHKAEDTEEGLL